LLKEVILRHSRVDILEVMNERERGLYLLQQGVKGWKILGELSEGTTAFAGWKWGQFQFSCDSPTLATPTEEGMAAPKLVVRETG
jgi:hypothetical protein